MKKKMILADCDERYMKELAYFFMERVPQLELVTFTKKEKMYQYLEQGNAVDILVVDEMLAGERLKGLTPDVTRIAMSVSMSGIDGFEVIKKYQKMENLSDAILLKYAEEKGTLETVKGDNDTKIAAFFNPAGGTGKTALALALATAGARAGMRVLYLNLEEIDSTDDVLGKTEGTLSDVFLALKTKGMNAGIKLKASAGMEETAGFYYVSGVESISEYEEITGKDLQKLLRATAELAIYDLVIVDQASGFTERTKVILKEADTILVPVILEEDNMAKWQRLLGESRLHDSYEGLFQKMKMILNKAGAAGWGNEPFFNELCSRMPCCASIPLTAVLAKRSSILHAGDATWQFMRPILQVVTGREIND